MPKVLKCIDINHAIEQQLKLIKLNKIYVRRKSYQRIGCNRKTFCE